MGGGDISRMAFVTITVHSTATIRGRSLIKIGQERFLKNACFEKMMQPARELESYSPAVPLQSDSLP